MPDGESPKYIGNRKGLEKGGPSKMNLEESSTFNTDSSSDFYISGGAIWQNASDWCLG